jgi:hypothetical protein
MNRVFQIEHSLKQKSPSTNARLPLALYQFPGGQEEGSLWVDRCASRLRLTSGRHSTPHAPKPPEDDDRDVLYLCSPYVYFMYS